MGAITIPFKQREYQRPLNEYILNGGLRAFALWHRRSGKDVDMWNLMIRMATQKVGLYFYFLPTYTQAKKVIWDGITTEGRKFLDYIPDEIIDGEPNSTEMKIKICNGSIIQLIGTDNYDAIRGTNPIGCVFSEFAFQNPQAWEVVKPILRVNGGWAVFNTTPNGKNHAFDMFQMAKDDHEWFCERLTIDDTNILTSEDIQKERREGMSEEMIQQEYYCSFDIGALGSYYASLVEEARKQERICSVPHVKGTLVDTYWDLGRNDQSAIIFVQQFGKEIRIIDYYEASGYDIGHYIEFLKSKPYLYGVNYLPHDAAQERLEAKKSIEAQVRDAGFRVEIIERADILTGIQQVRKLFPQFWFDKENCKQLIRCVENYHKEWDEQGKVFRQNPKHDWSSHGSDALRGLAMSYREKKKIKSSIDRFVEEKFDRFAGV